jgi:hypothetical protein
MVDERRLGPWGVLLAGMLALALAAALARPAQATVVLTTTLSNTPQDSQVTLLDLGSGSGNGLVSSATGYFAGANSVSFAGSAGIYHGSVAGTAAAPVLNGQTIAGNYFAAEPSGNVTYQFTAPQHYFGMLWGSVDSFNVLTFYNGTQVVKRFTGSDIAANPTGSQAADGSFYVAFNFTSSSQFTRVVVSSSSPAFEFGSVSYSTMNVDVTGKINGTPTVVQLTSTPQRIPAPGAVALLPGLLALGLLRPRGRRRMSAV